MARRPRYWEADSLHLLNRAGGVYLRLADQHILKWLEALCADGRAYGKFLPQYPAVMCEPLDTLYVCRRASCTLDEELLQDLLSCFSWREASWGAWLAALAPSPAYAAHLEVRKPGLPHGSVVIGLALAACGAMAVPAALGRHSELLGTLRAQIEELPRVTSPMRLHPTAEQEMALRVETDLVREAYRRGGRAAAQEALSRLSSCYRQGHTAWVRSHLKGE